jgi:hypothetical protein
MPESLTGLAAHAKVSREVAKRVCGLLAQHGWLEHRADGYRIRPVAVIPESCQVYLAELVEMEYGLVEKKGELLMKRLLDLMIASDAYVDNARPGFLINPLTGELLEYDRYYYLLGAAFEFNGSQHYELTERYSSVKQLKEIRNRDLVKKGRSLEANVTLVTVTGNQLHPDVLESLIPPILPRRPLDKNGPYFAALTRLCIGYAAKAASGPVR